MRGCLRGCEVEDAGRLSRVFKALSVDTRVRIVQMLKERNLCVGALAARLGVSSAAVSQHLRILRDADLVVGEKHGYFVHYRLNPDTLDEWRALVTGLLDADDG